MDSSVGSVQLGHLLIEGAVIAVSVELVFRCIFSPSGQKSWLIRSLRIIMALAMIIKSSLFSAFSSSALTENGCKLAGKLADVFYHISSLAGLYILLLRVMILAPDKYKTFFRVLHICFMIIRLALGAADTVLSRIWADTSTGVCRYKDVNQAGVVYTFFDFVLDIYVSFTVTFILLTHIRKLRITGAKGNFTLYISVVLANVFRTIILSVFNLLSALYFIISHDNPVMVRIIWPMNNLFFIVLIGYDTDITKALTSLQSRMLRIRQQQQKKCVQDSEKHESASSTINKVGPSLCGNSRVKPNQSSFSPFGHSNSTFAGNRYSAAATVDTSIEIASTVNGSTVFDMTSINNPAVHIQHSTEHS